MQRQGKVGLCLEIKLLRVLMTTPPSLKTFTRPALGPHMQGLSSGLGHRPPHSRAGSPSFPTKAAPQPAHCAWWGLTSAPAFRPAQDRSQHREEPPPHPAL